MLYSWDKSNFVIMLKKLLRWLCVCGPPACSRPQPGNLWEMELLSDLRLLNPKLSGWGPAFSCVLPRLPGDSDALLMWALLWRYAVFSLLSFHKRVWARLTHELYLKAHGETWWGQQKDSPRVCFRSKYSFHEGLRGHPLDWQHCTASFGSSLLCREKRRLGSGEMALSQAPWESGKSKVYELKLTRGSCGSGTAGDTDHLVNNLSVT